MAVSERNQVGVEILKLDPFESKMPRASQGLEDVQPWGILAGKTIHWAHDKLMDPGRNFIYTEVGTSGVAGVLQAPTSALPPVFRMTTGATQHDNCQIQSAVALTASATSAGTATGWAPFIAKAGFNINFRCRFLTASTAVNPAILIGLAPIDDTLLVSSTYGQASFVGMFKATGSATINGIIRTGSTNTTVTHSAGTVVIATWHTFEMRVIGRTAIQFWFDGVMVGSTTMTNLPANTVTLAPSVCVAAGTAAAANLDLQTLVCFQEAI